MKLDPEERLMMGWVVGDDVCGDQSGTPPRGQDKAGSKTKPPRTIRQGFAPVGAPEIKKITPQGVERLDTNPAGQKGLTD